MQDAKINKCQYPGCDDDLPPLKEGKSGNRKYCVKHKEIANKEALDRAWQRQKAKRLAARKGGHTEAPTKPCCICKSAEIPNTPKHKYCADCRIEVDKQLKRKHLAIARQNRKSLRLQDKQPQLTKAKLTEAQISAIEAEQMRINKEARAREDRRCGFKPDLGRKLSEEEKAAIAHTITPIELIKDSYDYEAFRGGI